MHVNHNYKKYAIGFILELYPIIIKNGYGLSDEFVGICEHKKLL